MERSDIFDMMGWLKLFGLNTVYDEIMCSETKHQHESPKFTGDKSQLEIVENEFLHINHDVNIAEKPSENNV